MQLVFLLCIYDLHWYRYALLFALLWEIFDSCAIDYACNYMHVIDFIFLFCMHMTDVLSFNICNPVIGILRSNSGSLGIVICQNEGFPWIFFNVDSFFLSESHLTCWAIKNFLVHILQQSRLEQVTTWFTICFLLDTSKYIVSLSCNLTFRPPSVWILVWTKSTAMHLRGLIPVVLSGIEVLIAQWI